MAKTDPRSPRALVAIVVAMVASTSGCGLVNAFGGPWPPSSSSDGGPEPLVDGGCPDGQHNGGDGSCVPEGECADDFTVERAGRCSAWTLEPTISPARTLTTATTLADGRVLVVGGKSPSTVTADAFVYDPVDATWSRPAGSVRARYHHRAIPIAGNRVLVAGGRGEDDALLATAALYRTDQDTLVDAGDLLAPRERHELVEVTGGSILVLGGRSASGAALAAVERLDAGRWVSAGFSLNTARSDFRVVTLGDGRVLALGGQGGDGTALASVELYDPAGAGGFTAATPMVDARTHFTATLLDGGRVLVVGGYADSADGPAPIRTAELYDPATDSWEDAGFMSVPRAEHGAVRLSDGRVLVAGGFSSGGGALSSVEIFDPAAGAFADGPPLSVARGAVAIAALEDGGALVVQGSTNAAHDAVATTSERYRVTTD